MACILTVDDSLSIRKMLSLTLGSAGFDVVQAVDGLDALEMANQHNFDVAVVDVNMPRMDGYELVQKLRQDERFRFKPILILTTESSKESKMKGREAGATGWIVKPFDPQVLLATIDKILG